ncbi:hypothetical protein BLNAU_384 [Blattamonas nauphoetae]|uniref:Uncharacterized protein n=1 Tax=Blattamonas nauphoetae TaxID=2049346 RepID=A0ABQ9YL33_9EUKA|nr:hypothetical protein BLNAU_384 [Blattamonas nauphoetae]
MNLQSDIGKYQELHTVLTNMMSTTKVQTFIPLGSKAFVPGVLKHTNEIKVYIGCDLYVLKTAKGALDVVQRRMDKLQLSINEEKQTLETMRLNMKQTLSTIKTALPSDSHQPQTHIDPAGFLQIEEFEDTESNHQKNQQTPIPTQSPPSAPFTEQEKVELNQLLAKYEALEKDESNQRIPKPTTQKQPHQGQQHIQDGSSTSSVEMSASSNTTQHQSHTPLPSIPPSTQTKTLDVDPPTSSVRPKTVAQPPHNAAFSGLVIEHDDSDDD